MVDGQRLSGNHRSRLNSESERNMYNIQCTVNSKQQAVDEMNTEHRTRWNLALEFLYVNNFKFVFSCMLFLLFFVVGTVFRPRFSAFIIIFVYRLWNVCAFYTKLTYIDYYERSEATQRERIFFFLHQRNETNIRTKKRIQKEAERDLAGVEKCAHVCVRLCVWVFLDAANVRFLAVWLIKGYMIMYNAKYTFLRSFLDENQYKCGSQIRNYQF